MNISPAKPVVDPAEFEPDSRPDRLPKFLLSAVQPCQVVLVSDGAEQSPPSKTQAELLADGQCEV